ncbi:TPA: hypothetical protein QCI16_002861 [Enterobacter ludwigii]|nr:hypothetical protein [Enterobacter ludwigii]HDR2591118.1 hypothetical protein [Enterobacter ludwigii]HDR2598687.1 hypothetical protein [Enterobacter ludwigii]
MRARLSGPQADHRIYVKAAALLREFNRGRKVFSRTHSRGYLVIRIGPFWRLLSKDNGAQWRLMTHATYNQEISK